MTDPAITNETVPNGEPGIEGEAADHQRLGEHVACHIRQEITRMLADYHHRLRLNPPV